MTADSKVFNFKKVSPLPANFSCEYFTLTHKTVSGGYSFLTSGKQCELLFVVKSEDLKAAFTVNGEKSSGINLSAEEIFAVTPGEKITLEGHGEVIRIRP